MFKPKKIISGGQTGADQGALVGAQDLGIATGGWMPKGFMTETGPIPDQAYVFGLREHKSPHYPPRTRQNVVEADGTIWVGDDPNSPGRRCTYKYVEQYAKPFLNNPTPQTLRQWAAHYEIEVLNVAGSRASKDPQAFNKARSLILEAFGEP